jgi:hypothetical protein
MSAVVLRGGSCRRAGSELMVSARRGGGPLLVRRGCAAACCSASDWAVCCGLAHLQFAGVLPARWSRLPRSFEAFGSLRWFGCRFGRGEHESILPPPPERAARPMRCGDTRRGAAQSTRVGAADAARWRGRCCPGRQRSRCGAAAWRGIRGEVPRRKRDLSGRAADAGRRRGRCGSRCGRRKEMARPMRAGGEGAANEMRQCVVSTASAPIEGLR